MKYQKLVDGISERMYTDVGTRLGRDVWDLIPDAGKSQIAEVLVLLTECALREAAGEDVSNAKAALTAAIGNWEMAGEIRAAGMADDFLDGLKKTIVEAASIGLTLLGAGLKGLIA